MADPLYLNALGVVSPLGVGKKATFDAMIAGDQSNMIRTDKWSPNVPEIVGTVSTDLPSLPQTDITFQSRNNRLLHQAVIEIEDDILSAISEFGADRIAVLIGTSTSGIEESEQAMKVQHDLGAFPAIFHLGQQEIGSPSAFLAAVFGIRGPVYSVSSACASGGKALAAAARLIRTNICDAVIVGGADSLCRMTVRGFRSLQALSDDICNPMSRNRNGTNIGEGAAVFLMSRRKSDICFLGAGESSDAHHISAPEPEGIGAEAAMRRALQASGVKADDICYLNMHGTATPLNDSMESAAISRIFQDRLPVSSSKPMTGHALGAAGAIEAALIWLSLVNARDTVPVIPHIWDGEIDPDIAPANLLQMGDTLSVKDRLVMMSNSFAFGGSNVSVILAREM